MNNNLQPAYIKHSKMKPSNAQSIKALGKAMGVEILPEVVLPIYKEKRKRAKETKPRQKLEKKLQRDIILYLRLHGAVAGKVKAEAGMFNGIRLKSNLLFIGVPDILCFHLGKQFWIEVKIETGRLSIEQHKFQQLCYDSGIAHIVARSVDDIKFIVKAQIG